MHVHLLVFSILHRKNSENYVPSSHIVLYSLLRTCLLYYLAEWRELVRESCDVINGDDVITRCALFAWEALCLSTLFNSMIVLGWLAVSTVHANQRTNSSRL